LNVLADGLKLLVSISIENIRPKPCSIVGVSVTGHFGVGYEPSWIKHPLVKVSRAEPLVCNSKIYALNFKGSNSWLFVDGVARYASIPS
jgi:hypothetical protein